ncbi:hypothetical protein Bca4012_019281 [Brassica carinata]
MMKGDGWNVKDLEMDALRNLVNSYTERHSKTSVVALKRIFVVVETLLKENKGWVSLLGLSREKHPSPTLSEEAEGEMLISHVLEMINVIVSDFDMMKNGFNKVVDPRYVKASVVNFRALVDNSRSKMLKTIDELVLKELKSQKAEDTAVAIERASSRTTGYLMDRLVVGVLENPNPLESLSKLKRIQECLCDVISLGRNFILTHRFVPQPKSFPDAQLSQSVGQGSPMPLVKQHVSDACAMIDLVDDCLDLIKQCDLGNLRNYELEEVSQLVTKIVSTLEERAFEEGGVYPAEENW